MPSSIISRARIAIAKAIAPAQVARPHYPQLTAPRRYPDYNPSRSSILGQEHSLGRSGLRYFYPGWIRNEPLSELQGTKKYLVFKEMGDMNAYCAAALNAFTMFLRRAKWRVDPVEDENKTNGSAEFLEQCMEDMEHSWSTFIAQVSRVVPQMGFCPFEIIYKLRNGEDEDDDRRSSKYDDGKIGWQNFAIRFPETVFHWVWYPDDPSRLRGLVQLAPPDYPSDLFIPIEKILLLRAEPGEDNPEGRSILRSSFKPFIISRWMEDARNSITEHAGTGIPKAELPPNICNPYPIDPVTGQRVLDGDGNPIVDPVALATLDSVKQSLMNMRLNEEPYIIVPAQYDDKGHKLFDVSFMTNNGGSMIGEINNTIREEGMKILMSCMAEFLALGTNATGGGSFALSRDKTDNFSLAVTALLDLFQESINNQAVKRLFKLNPEFDSLEVLPRIVHDPIVPININEVSAVLSGFKGIGWDLTKEANAEEIKNAILEAVGLPKAAKKDEANDEGETKPEAMPEPEEGKQPEELKIPPVPKTKAVKPESGGGGSIDRFQFSPDAVNVGKSEIKKKKCKEHPPGSGDFTCPKTGKPVKDKSSKATPSKPNFTKLDSNQKTAVLNYTDSSRDITSFILTGKVTEDYEGDDGRRFKGTIQEQIDALDDAMVAAGPVPSGTYFRGINWVASEAMEKAGQLKEGVEFIYTPFMSITSDFELAKEDFGWIGQGTDGGADYHVIKLVVPDGINGITLNENSSWDWQSETVLARNHRFRVGKTYIKDDVKVTEMVALARSAGEELGG